MRESESLRLDEELHLIEAPHQKLLIKPSFSSAASDPLRRYLTDGVKRGSWDAAANKSACSEESQLVCML
jgi:hypothetical protein